MKYIYGQGVIIPFAQKYRRALIATVAALFLVTQAIVLAGLARADDNTPPPGADCLTTEFNGNSTTTCIVQITCEVVSIWSDRDLSNVIVFYDDGTPDGAYLKFNATNFGTTQTWGVPQGIVVGLWIHAGNNTDFPGDPLPAEFNNGGSVGRYHTVETPDCEEEETVTDEQQLLGSISGLIYHDEDNNGDQNGTEPPLIGWNAWLLTFEGTFVLEAEDTTGSDGLFEFPDLSFGTYYVCQNLLDGWTQTEFPALGSGLEPATPGTDLGNDTELIALINQFCYSVTIDEENPISDVSIFGNYFPPVEETEEETDDQPDGQVLGDSTENDGPDTDEKEGGRGQGQVLAASTGQVLAATGQPAWLPIAIGSSLLFANLLVWRLTSRVRQN